MQYVWALHFWFLIISSGIESLICDKESVQWIIAIEDGFDTFHKLLQRRSSANTVPVFQ